MMKIGIVGFGNLGHSLAEGLLMSGTKAHDIFVCEKSEATRDLALAKYGIKSAEDLNLVLVEADVIFLTVKSYVFEDLAKSIDRGFLEGKIVISFMAGVPFEQIYSLIGHVTLIRAMPSLAISVCDGVIGYTASPPEIVELFEKLGYAFEAEPEDIEKVMAFSSCGLGFAAYLIDAFASAGASLGFSQETCEKIAAQTFKNAINRGDYKNTVKSVATPGGATEQGVLYMDGHNVYETISGAVGKAYDKMK